ncbi:hypothetical protein OUZ56_002133 [Daphnia magna]|uniref:Uncharacterized protein n=1 Tax=Daphnia magna TaxID=35525 RepID=A0ABR0A586_9CRUS|nr:hypothetical protein OUZ56_002133 [Daphnia magna]
MLGGVMEYFEEVYLHDDRFMLVKLDTNIIRLLKQVCSCLPVKATTPAPRYCWGVQCLHTGSVSPGNKKYEDLFRELDFEELCNKCKKSVSDCFRLLKQV